MITFLLLLTAPVWLGILGFMRFCGFISVLGSILGVGAGYHRK